MQEGLRGDLTTWPLAEILGMLGRSKQTGQLDIRNGTRSGRISVNGGAIVEAKDGPLVGTAAVVSLATWAGGEFAFAAGKVEGRGEPITPGLLEQLALVAEEARELRLEVPADAMPQVSTERPNAQVTIDPLEWRILSVLRSVRSLEELRDAAGCDDLELMRSSA